MRKSYLVFALLCSLVNGLFAATGSSESDYFTVSTAKVTASKDQIGMIHVEWSDVGIRCDLYRRKTKAGEWERIAAGLTKNSYIDYKVEYGYDYEYVVAECSDYRLATATSKGRSAGRANSVANKVGSAIGTVIAVGKLVDVYLPKAGFLEEDDRCKLWLVVKEELSGYKDFIFKLESAKDSSKKAEWHYSPKQNDKVDSVISVPVPRIGFHGPCVLTVTADAKFWSLKFDKVAKENVKVYFKKNGGASKEPNWLKYWPSDQALKSKLLKGFSYESGGSANNSGSAKIEFEASAMICGGISYSYGDKSYYAPAIYLADKKNAIYRRKLYPSAVTKHNRAEIKDGRKVDFVGLECDGVVSLAATLLHEEKHITNQEDLCFDGIIFKNYLGISDKGRIVDKTFVKKHYDRMIALKEHNQANDKVIEYINKYEEICSKISSYWIKDEDGDGLRDDFETGNGQFKFNKNDSDTFKMSENIDTAGNKLVKYKPYGDDEVLARKAEEGAMAYVNLNNDWAFPGAQISEKFPNETDENLFFTCTVPGFVPNPGKSTVRMITNLARGVDNGSVYTQHESSQSLESLFLYNDFENPHLRIVDGRLDASDSIPVKILTYTLEIDNDYDNPQEVSLKVYFTNEKNEIVLSAKKITKLDVGSNKVLLDVPGTEVYRAHASELKVSFVEIRSSQTEFEELLAASTQEIRLLISLSYDAFEPYEACIVPGEYQPSVIDGNITVEVPVINNSGLEYELRADLVAGDGKIIGAMTSPVVGLGEKLVTLTFPCIDIALSQKDGPYEIKYLSLKEKDTERYVDSLSSAGSTLALRAADFKPQNVPVRVLSETLVCDDTLKSKDGKIDKIAFSVDVEYQGEEETCCEVLAYIDTAEANKTCLARSLVWVAPGYSTLEWSVPAEEIIANGAEGPYTIRAIKLDFDGHSDWADIITPNKTINAKLNNFGAKPFELTGEVMCEKGTEKVPYTITFPIKAARNDKVTASVIVLTDDNQIVGRFEKTFFVNAGKSYSLKLPITAEDLATGALPGPYVIDRALLHSNYEGVKDIQISSFSEEVNYNLKDGGPYHEVVDGVEWTFIVENGEVIIGTNDGTAAIPDTTTGTIEVPATLGGHPVTTIGQNAFRDCADITSVKIPASVTEVKPNAFTACDNLATITVAENDSGVAESVISSSQGIDMSQVAFWTFSGVEIELKQGAEMPPVSILLKIGGVAVSDYTFTAQGLPSGLKLVEGKIVGTPTAAGSFVVKIKASKKDEVPQETSLTLTIRPVSVAVELSDPNMGAISGDGDFAVNKKVTLKATPTVGCVFAGWYQDSDYLIPLEVEGVDYRSATISLPAPGEDSTIYARFVPKEEDAESLVDDSLLINGRLPGSLTSELDSQEDIDWTLAVKSLSIPKVTVSGLPKGLKFDAKTLTITGKPTAPGVYDVVCSISNLSSGNTPQKYTFRIKVKNFVDSLIPIPGSFGPYIPGVAQSFVLEEADGCAVSGLPAGLKWDIKTSTVSGTPTKPGLYTVLFTKTVDKVKHTASATFEVLPLRVLNCENVKGAGSFAANAKVTLKATPKAGTVFAGWYKDAAFTAPVIIPGFDYRNPTLSFTMGESDMTLYARYITPKEDSLDIQLWNGMLGYVYLNAGDGGFDPIEKFKIKSESFPTIKITGLPAGLKYDAKTGLVTGTVTEKNPKWGVLTINVKNASGYTATAVYPMSINWAEDPASMYPQEVSTVMLPFDDRSITTENVYDYQIGSDESSKDSLSDYGWSSSSSYSVNTAISGLPTGLKIATTKETYSEKDFGYSFTSTSKIYTLVGTPTKPGKFTVKISSKTSSSYKATGEPSDSYSYTEVTKMDVYVQQTPSKYFDAVVIEGEDYVAHGKITGAGVYASGTTVNLKATPDKGYVFVGWYLSEDTNEYYSLNPNESFVMNGSAPEALYARFMPVQDDKVIDIELMPDMGMFFVDEDTLKLEFIEDEAGLLNFDVRCRSEGGFGSAATITAVNGLPSGVTAVKSGSAITSLTYKKNATIAPGVYPVTITAKNQSGYTVTKTISVIVPHRPDEFFGVNQDPGYMAYVGEPINDECASDIVELGAVLENIYYGYEGKVSASVSGLPSGLSIKITKVKGEWGEVTYTARVVGAAKKVGTYIATIKASGTYYGEEINETATFTVTVLPEIDEQ